MQAFHYERHDIALMGFAKFMKDQSGEEREHAMKLMKVSEIYIHILSIPFASDVSLLEPISFLIFRALKLLTNQIK